VANLSARFMGKDLLHSIGRRSDGDKLYAEGGTCCKCKVPGVVELGAISEFETERYLICEVPCEWMSNRPLMTPDLCLAMVRSGFFIG
jgi:hypothetical protein